MSTCPPKTKKGTTLIRLHLLDRNSTTKKIPFAISRINKIIKICVLDRLKLVHNLFDASQNRVKITKDNIGPNIILRSIHVNHETRRIKTTRYTFNNQNISKTKNTNFNKTRWVPK